MAKGLINILGRGVKKGLGKAVLVTTILSGIACSGSESGTDPEPIKNSPPKIISNPIVQIDEMKNYSYNANAEDDDGDGLEYSFTQAPNWLTINKGNGLISGIAPEVYGDTNYDVGIKVSDGESFDTQNWTLTVKNVEGPTIPEYIDLSGKIEDCETNTGRHGFVRIYDDRVNLEPNPYFGPKWEYNNLLEEVETDSAGNFSVTLDKLVDAGDKIYVRARLSDSDWENGTSYIRTIELDAVDQTPITNPRANPAIRPVSFDSDFDHDGEADIDRDYNGIDSQEILDFREHVGRINIWSDPERSATGIPGALNKNPKHGLKKLNHGELEDLIGHPTFKRLIMDTNSLSQTEMDDDENAIRNSGYPGVGEIEILREPDPVSGNGWYAIYHSDLLASHYPSLPYGPCTLSWDQNQDGYLEKSKSYLNTTAPEIVNHEVVYHGLMACPGHADGSGVPALFLSIGEYSGIPVTSLSPVDKKAANLINEETNIGMDSLDDVLGVD